MHGAANPVIFFLVPGFSANQEHGLALFSTQWKGWIFIRAQDSAAARAWFDMCLNSIPKKQVFPILLLPFTALVQILTQINKELFRETDPTEENRK